MESASRFLSYKHSLPLPPSRTSKKLKLWTDLGLYSPLSTASQDNITEFASQPDESKLIFLWVILRIPRFQRLPTSLFVEMCGFIRDPIVCSVQRKGVCVVDIETCTPRSFFPFDLEIAFRSLDVKSVVLGFDTVFILDSGREGTLTHSYLALLQGNQAVVQILPAMTTHRIAPGVFAYRNEVFVLGGSLYPGSRNADPNNAQKCGEALDTSLPPAWVNLPNEMQVGRWRFTPSLWTHKAYICGGSPPSSPMEVFNLVTRRFELGPEVSLPFAYCATAVVASTLLLFAEGESYSLDLKDSRGRVRKLQGVCEDPSADAMPIVCKEMVFWAIGRYCTRVKWDGLRVVARSFEV